MQEESNGTVYESVYSPRINDTNWIGLHPTDDFAHYISVSANMPHCATA